MKVRRLLLCLIMSVMLVVTYIPVTAFAADGESMDEAFENAIPITLNEEVTIDNESYYQFVPDEDGIYLFRSSGADEDSMVHGIVRNEYGYVVADRTIDGQRGFKIYFEATEGSTYYLKGEVYYLKGDDTSGNSPFNMCITGHDFCDIQFEPSEEYLVDCYCDEELDGSELFYFNPGDRLTLTTTEGEMATYEYGFGVVTDPEYGVTSDAGVFLSEDGVVLAGFPSIRIDSWVGVTAAKYNNGQTVEKEAYVEYDSLLVPVDITIKFDLTHDKMKKIAAKAATCTKAGNKAYWYCSDCKKFFSNSAGTKQIKKNSWVIKAKGHKWTHKETKGGLLERAIEYDQCTVCKAKKNVKAIPGTGYSHYYVKSFKVKRGNKSFTAKWKKQKKSVRAKFDGYQIRYCKAKKGSKYKYVTVKKTKKSKKIKGLKNGTKYKVQVRTFTKVNGTTFYSKWSSVKTVTPKGKGKKKPKPPKPTNRPTTPTSKVPKPN